jgi:malate dehydrogenase (quinone)
MFNYLTSLEGVTMHFNHEVRKINERIKLEIKVTDYLQVKEKDIY